MRAVLSCIGPRAPNMHEMWDSAASGDMKPILSAWLQRRENVF